MAVEYGGIHKLKADWSTYPIEGHARAAMEQGKNGYFSCPLITEVLPNLWVGGCVHNIELPADFKYVVSLYKWERYRLAPGTVREEIEMYDAGELPDLVQLNEIADKVNEFRAQGRTLVHCQAGLNRSNLVTALALIKSGFTPTDAVDLLREKRSPMVLCNKAFENWILQQGQETHEQQDQPV